MGGPGPGVLPAVCPAPWGMKVPADPASRRGPTPWARPLTRTTMDVELFADTQKRRLFIPNLEISREIPSSYTLEDAERDARQGPCWSICAAWTWRSPRTWPRSPSPGSFQTWSRA